MDNDGYHFSVEDCDEDQDNSFNEPSILPQVHLETLLITRERKRERERTETQQQETNRNSFYYVVRALWLEREKTGIGQFWY